MVTYLKEELLLQGIKNIISWTFNTLGQRLSARNRVKTFLSAQTIWEPMLMWDLFPLPILPLILPFLPSFLSFFNFYFFLRRYFLAWTLLFLIHVFKILSSDTQSSISWLHKHPVRDQTVNILVFTDHMVFCQHCHCSVKWHRRYVNEVWLFSTETVVCQTLPTEHSSLPLHEISGMKLSEARSCACSSHCSNPKT